MGSAAGTAEEVIDQLLTQNEKVGMIKVHLHRQFSTQHFLNVIPKAVNSIVVLDRTK